MVVQHNLIAMNTNRMLGITSNNQAKSSEKLSSGYKINRAADDAAGLAISEKMRKQVKGLDRASTNAQDGVSSVQTAEGALTEVHSMLQRMNELAVQAANGTNSVEDRDAIQAEISLLSEEIDRVAETTKFNETYLLKGSEAKTRHYLVAHDAGLKGRLTDGTTTAQFEISTFWAGDTVRIGNTDYEIGYGKEDAKELINKIANEMASNADRAVDAGAQKVVYEGKAAVQATNAANATTTANNYRAAGNTASATEYDNRANHYSACSTAYTNVATAYGELETKCQTSIEDKTLTIGEKTYTAEYNKAYTPAILWTESPSGNTYTQNDFLAHVLPVPSKVDVVYTTGSTATDSDGTIKDAQKDVVALGTSAKAAGDAARNVMTSGYTMADAYPVTYSYTNGTGTYSIDHTAEYEEMGQQYELIEANYASLISSKEVIIGEGTWDASYIPEGNPAVAWTEYFSGKTTADLAAATTPVPTNRVNGYRVLYEAVTLNIMADDDMEGQGNGIDDNIPSLITRKRAYENIKRELLAANNIGATGQLAEIDINLEEKERRVRFLIDKGFAEVNAALNFALHAGSDADMTNKIAVKIDSMSTASLGIENMNLSDNSGLAATYAIDAINDAINKVSTQRSSLGAIQNRLEHSIANLDNVVENTTNAESRIRDTDMAEEMVEYSKNNILAQAGQAMLAQANQSTQGVLSLLQ